MFTDFCYATADLFMKYFSLIKSLHATPNVILIVVGFIANFWWIGQMMKYDKEAAENGTLR